MRNGIPLRVDPDFWLWAKDMVEKNPELNQRKVTKNIAKKKMIIGEIMFNPAFEDLVIEQYRKVKGEATKIEDEIKKRFGN